MSEFVKCVGVGVTRPAEWIITLKQCIPVWRTAELPVLALITAYFITGSKINFR